MGEKGFVFLDSLGKPYLCRVWGGEQWLHYWNDKQECFITLRPVNQSEVMAFPRNLTQQQQDMYLNKKIGIHE